MDIENKSNLIFLFPNSCDNRSTSAKKSPKNLSEAFIILDGKLKTIAIKAEIG